jgi:pimeloyl-ACP methyl ester carboxylesterase
MSDSNHTMILANGRFDATNRDQLRAAFETFSNSQQKDTLVIHFHGGLVSRAAAEEMADRLLPVYQAAGGYPFFVIWESQFWETLGNNWQEIARENAVSVLVEKVLQFLVGKINQSPGEKALEEVLLPTKFEVKDEIQEKRSQGREPYEDKNSQTATLDEQLPEKERQQFEDLLAKDPVLHDAAFDLAREGGPTLSAELETDMAQSKTAVEPGEKALITTGALVAAGVRILTRVLKRCSSGRDHGLYTTVVEEVARELKGDKIGGLLWKLMKKDTADSFQDPDAEYGGSALLKEIARLWEAGSRPRIVLVGHSAGTVYICHLLTKAAEILPKEVTFDVVFLAPACSYKLLDSTLQAAGDRIKSFRSFGMKDDAEKKDAIFPPLYMCSLLYFVSGLLEDEVDYPLVGMERFASAAFNRAAVPEIDRVQQKFAAFQTPWVWSASNAGPGLTSMALKHGDFDNEQKTLDSLVYLITNRSAP